MRVYHCLKSSNYPWFNIYAVIILLLCSIMLTACYQQVPRESNSSENYSQEDVSDATDAEGQNQETSYNDMDSKSTPEETGETEDTNYNTTAITGILETHDGYQLKRTVNIGDFVYTKDEDAMQSAWEAVGGTGSAPACESILDAFSSGKAADDLVTCFGNIKVENITDGFSFSESHPYTIGEFGNLYDGFGALVLSSAKVNLVFIASGEDSDGVFYERVYVGDNPVILRPGHNIVMKDNSLGPIPFAITTYGAAATPKNGGHDSELDKVEFYLISNTENSSDSASIVSYHPRLPSDQL